MPPPTPQLPPELRSWKEIASYLGVSVKTAQVWERDRQLPVRRLPGPRGQVHALITELSNWRASSPPPEAEEVPSTRWRFLVGAGVVVFLAAVVFASVVHRPRLTSVTVTKDALAGLDGAGNILWQKAFGRLNELIYANEERVTWVGALEGETKVLFVPRPAGIVHEPVPLVCLDDRGRELWRFLPGKTVHRGVDTFAPPFVVRQFVLIGNRIVVTSHHHLYFASQVAVLDTRGRLLREYWHPGHLNVLSQSTFAGRPVALLGGVNNARHLATLVVLDPDRLSGAALEAGRPVFDGMPPPVEAARLLFPRSDVSPFEPYNVVVQLHSAGGNTIVDVHERLNGADPPSIQYHLNQQLELTQMVVSDLFLSEHAQRTRHAFSPAEDAALHQLVRVR